MLSSVKSGFQIQRYIHTSIVLHSRKPRLLDLKIFPSQKANKMNSQDYDYFLVLDFEATCDDKRRLEPQVMKASFVLVYCKQI